MKKLVIALAFLFVAGCSTTEAQRKMFCGPDREVDGAFVDIGEQTVFIKHDLRCRNDYQP